MDISIHALLAESDGIGTFVVDSGIKFLSTLSLRRATYDTYAKVLRVNISIHALLAESDRSRLWGPGQSKISIHALLAESDPSTTRRLTNLIISIHALLAESDVLRKVPLLGIK